VSLVNRDIGVKENKNLACRRVGATITAYAGPKGHPTA